MEEKEILKEPETVEEASKPDPLASITKTLETFGEALSVLLDDKNARQAAEAERTQAEALRQESQLTEVEKLRKERELIQLERQGWEVQRKEASKAELERSRDYSMDRLGVLPQYRSILPAEIDPRSSEGQAALEKFFSDKGAMLKTKETVPSSTARPSPALDEGFFSKSYFDASGVSKNKLTDIATIQKNILENTGKL